MIKTQKAFKWLRELKPPSDFNLEESAMVVKMRNFTPARGEPAVGLGEWLVKNERKSV